MKRIDVLEKNTKSTIVQNTTDGDEYFLKEDVLQAMTKFAVGFAEWCSFYQWVFIEIDNNWVSVHYRDIWFKIIDFDEYGNEIYSYKTTEELLKMYEEEITKGTFDGMFQNMVGPEEMEKITREYWKGRKPMTRINEIDNCQDCKYCYPIHTECEFMHRRIDVPYRTEIPDWCPLPVKEEQVFCPHCGKYKRLPGNGILVQLCECGI